jgi:hypothetical protein
MNSWMFWCYNDMRILSSSFSLKFVHLQIKLINGLNILGTKFLHENVKCYELKQVMQKTDLNFINI